LLQYTPPPLFDLEHRLSIVVREHINNKEKMKLNADELVNQKSIDLRGIGLNDNDLDYSTK